MLRPARESGEQEGDTGREDGAKGTLLDRELDVLRDSLARAHGAMKSGEEDMPRAGMLVARLADSLSRALLAQQRLQSTQGGQAEIEARFDDALRTLGLGEE